MYDAQYDETTSQKRPIPQHVIDEILATLTRFQTTCADFGVPESNHKILATEATRNAVNAAEFIRQIETGLNNQATKKSWKVEMLAKEDEGRIGGLGVVSSVGCTGVEGLVMDLGGGSTQITWLIAHDGEIQMYEKGSISLPYGAAATTRLLSEIDKLPRGKDVETARLDLREKMTQQFRQALLNLNLPTTLKNTAEHPGLTLYLSGGGFRGWGYFLLSSHKIRPYPIPIVNGFCASVKEFKNTSLITSLASAGLEDNDNVFRISNRRAAQVPAVSFLIDCLIQAIPTISNVRICQGGVREGALFQMLPKQIRAQDPLEAGSAVFAVEEQSALAFATLLHSALPPDCEKYDRSIPGIFKQYSLLKTFANLLWLQQGQNKESAAVNALQTTITGELASVHGAGHGERALLALMLCQRWGGGDVLPPPYGDTKTRLELLVGNRETWWARYVGAIGRLLGEVYPAGRVRQGSERIAIRAKWCAGLGKKGNMQGVKVKVLVKDAVITAQSLVDCRDELEDIGKKKNRVGGKEYGFGVLLKVDIEMEV